MLALAVLVSLIFTSATTPNPAHIPFLLLFRRALWGMALFVFFWLTICSLLYGLLLKVLPSLGSMAFFNWCIPVLIGLLVPQSGKLKDAFLTPSAAKKLKILQVIDEETRLYLSRIITREERKVSTAFFLTDDCKQRYRALDRLFESCSVEIAREEARKGASPESVLGIFRVRDHTVKFKYLIRFLGHSECLRELLAATAHPEMILPTWPPDLGDRRGSGAGNDTTAGKLILGRRKYEQASLQAYVLGIGGTKKKYQVFVSSTFLDLREERQQVLRGLLGAECIPAGMEFFPSSDEELWSLIRAVVDDCDYYLLLVAGRYGSTTKDGISYTEAEYDYAVETGKPVLAFLDTNPKPVPGVADESPEKQERLRLFKEKLCNAHSPGYWSTPEEIPFLVQKAIEHVKRLHPGVGWIRYERDQPEG